MGIIIKQSIKGSIWSYLGVGIGFVTTGYLFPNYLATDTIGLFGLIVSWSILLAQIFSLGFNGITSRLFPYFRNKEKGHNGFLFIAFIVMFIGFGLFLAAFFIFSPWLAENNAEKSQMFSEYIWLLIPLTFFMMLYLFLDMFNKLLYDAVFGTFLIEFLQRLLILIIVLLFVFKIIDLPYLILAYAGAVSAKGAIMFFYLLWKGEMSLKPQLKFIDKKLKNGMISVATYSLLTGIGANLFFSLDKIIINQMLGLSATGIYTIASFFGSLVMIPSRPLLRISGTLIAEAWKKDDVNYISDIYKRSCLNQFLIGVFLFGGIWINIDSILTILGPEYSNGKWVIFFMGIGTIIKMASGANGLIIGYSKYYRMALWFLLIQIIVFLVAMYTFIPVWGIAGAAGALTLSVLTGNSIRYIFLFHKYKMQPFTKHFFIVILAFAAAYLAGYFIPEQPLVLDILLRGSAFAVVYLALITGLRISSDVNSTIRLILAQTGIKK